MKVAVMTMFSPEYAAISGISVPIIEKYARRHGYTYAPISLPDADYPYAKIECIKQEFKRSDIVFYVDCDIILTNHTIKIESFLDGGYDLYVCGDFNEINFGAAIFKKTEWTNVFLDMILSQKEYYENEQNYLNKVYPAFSKEICIKKHPAFNSYDYSLYPECKDYVGREDLGDWQPGNFVIHFPGLALEKRIELMQEYSQKIIE